MFSVKEKAQANRIRRFVSRPGMLKIVRRLMFRHFNTLNFNYRLYLRVRQDSHEHLSNLIVNRMSFAIENKKSSGSINPDVRYLASFFGKYPLSDLILECLCQIYHTKKTDKYEEFSKDLSETLLSRMRSKAERES